MTEDRLSDYWRGEGETARANKFRAMKYKLSPDVMEKAERDVKKIQSIIESDSELTCLAEPPDGMAITLESLWDDPLGELEDYRRPTSDEAHQTKITVFVEVFYDCRGTPFESASAELLRYAGKLTAAAARLAAPG